MSRKKVSPEAAWLNCRAPIDGLPVVAKTASPRRLRLFAVACVRRVEDLCPAELAGPVRAAVEQAELFSDGKLTRTQLRQAREQFDAGYFSDEMTEGEVYAGDAVYAALESKLDRVLDAPLLVEYTVPGLAHDQGLPPTDPHRRAAELAVQVRLMHDVFGNPFRPVTFDSAWRTSTAVGLARTMYESRDFAAMPILADALEEAGCNSADVLAHCRGDGSHVRGCWVVDLVLGKT
ncbi:MAG TPA: hypothetical protein VM533_02605 [Fimbriiglobus sp.]|nr:hypothetical protein [Fimbriiglobus sp.]